MRRTGGWWESFKKGACATQSSTCKTNHSDVEKERHKTAVLNVLSLLLLLLVVLTCLPVSRHALHLFHTSLELSINGGCEPITTVESSVHIHTVEPPCIPRHNQLINSCDLLNTLGLFDAIRTLEPSISKLSNRRAAVSGGNEVQKRHRNLHVECGCGV